jgi:hypothetical protein
LINNEIDTQINFNKSDIDINDQNVFNN